MSPDNTARIVNLIVSTWPAGVKGHVWTDTLEQLEYDVARRAYIELRDTEERPPTVARYLATYYAKRHAARDEHPEYCELCGGDGWRPSPPERAHNPRTCRARAADWHPPLIETECFCTAIEPCRCTAGQRNRPVQHRIREHNDRNTPPWARHEPRQLELAGAAEPAQEEMF